MVLHLRYITYYDICLFVINVQESEFPQSVVFTNCVFQISANTEWEENSQQRKIKKNVI